MLLAEIGSDVQRFPTAKHLASWAGMCPDNHERAGKRLSGRTRTGSPWFRQALVEAAHGAARSKHTGGVNTLFGDGSIRFVRDSITPTTWMAMGTMNGGEVVQND